MEVKQNVSLVVRAEIFLKELRLLRESHKGKYISDLFCDRLEDLSGKIVETIQHYNYRGMVQKINHAQPLEKISDKMAGLCLECIEIYLQKIQNGADNSSDYYSSTERLGCGQIACEVRSIKVGYALDVAANSQKSFNQILQTLTHIACDVRALASYIRFTLYPTRFPGGKYSSEGKVFH